MLVIGDFGRELVHHCLWKQSLSKVVDRKQTSYGKHPNKTLSFQIVSLLRNTSSWQHNLLTSIPSATNDGRSRPFLRGPPRWYRQIEGSRYLDHPIDDVPTARHLRFRLKAWEFDLRHLKYLKCTTKLPNLWPCCGDVTKETSLRKFKNHEKKDRFMIHGKQNGMYCIRSCFSWPLPRIPLQKVFAVSLYCRSIFIDLSRADSAQIFDSIFKVLGEKQPPSHLAICWFFCTASERLMSVKKTPPKLPYKVQYLKLWLNTIGINITLLYFDIVWYTSLKI